MTKVPEKTDRGGRYVLADANGDIIVCDGEGDPADKLLTADQARALVLSHHLARTKPEGLRLYLVTPVSFSVEVHIDALPR